MKWPLRVLSGANMASQFPFKLFGPATRAAKDVNHVLLPVIKILVPRPQTTLRASNRAR